MCPPPFFFNILKTLQVELPLNVGVVNLYGLTCPADPGKP